MTQNTKEYISQNLKWPISNLSYLSNYFILIAPIVLIYIGITEYYRNNFTLTPFVTGMVLFVFITYRIETERKFIKLALTKDLSTDDLAKIVEKINWSLKNQDDNVFEFSTSISPISWGETVTVIKISRDTILVNSQPSGKNPFSFRDRVNYNKIKSAIET